MTVQFLWILRIAVLVLMFISIKIAAAGIFLEKAQTQFDHRKFEESEVLSRQSLRWEKNYPPAHYLAALTAMKLAKNQPQFLSRAQTEFEWLARHFPFWGRSYLYLAQIKKDEKLLHLAVQKEPGSAWVLYQAGRLLLSPEFHSSGKNNGLSYLKKAVEINPQSYLKPAMLQIWTGFKDLNILHALAPKDLPVFETPRKIAEEEKPVIHKPMRGWWSDKGARRRLRSNQKTGMLLELSAGKKILRIFIEPLQSLKDNPALIMIKSGNNIIGYQGLVYGRAENFDFLFEPAGGRQWLEAEVISQSSGPQGLIQLGDLKVFDA